MSQDNSNKPIIPIRKDKDIEIKAMEIDTVSRVISEKDLKTQYSQSERILIDSLEQLACHPFSISEEIAQRRNIKCDYTRYQFNTLHNWVKEYVRKGKALNRKGIKEDVDIVSAYFQAQIERAKVSQGSILTK